MKPLLLCLFALLGYSSFSQEKRNAAQFYTEDQPLDVTVVINMPKLLSNKMDEGRHTATLRCKLSDSVQIDEKVTFSVIGNFRRRNCYIPPMKFHFNKKNSPELAVLNSVKLTSCCKPTEMYDQYLLKEFLIYKMYNLITDRSFRVRLLNVTYLDSTGKKKPVTQHGFFVEDVKNLARRNAGKEWKKPNLHPEAAERQHMTLVAMFEYMIGNTDWAVPPMHNIKLIQPANDSLARPYPVPYDFDFSGLVNTNYSTPDPLLNTEKVTERVYRGFPRNQMELQIALDVFFQKKQAMYDLIKSFSLLSNESKKDMTRYLDEFYNTVSKASEVQYIFIDNARKE